MSVEESDTVYQRKMREKEKFIYAPLIMILPSSKYESFPYVEMRKI